MSEEENIPDETSPIPPHLRPVLHPDQEAKVRAFKKLPRAKTGRPGREFGPLLKMAATVLHDAGMTITDIAAELRISTKTVQKALLNKSVKIETSDMNKVREGFATNIAQIINKMLMAANTDEYVRNLMSAKNQAMVMGIAVLIDKLNLLTGKPTSIIETKDMVESVQKQLKDLEELEQALKKHIALPQEPKEN